jgi:AcrR family transcriptional regulator
VYVVASIDAAMGSDVTDTPRLGLRERKKQHTRETIERVALELFAERGYDATTLAEIAEAADISPRTIFGYFQSKEDILFCEEPAYIEKVRDALQQRPAGATTVDALRDFISSMPPPDDQTMLRKQVVAANPDLQMKLRAHIGLLEDVLSESIAQDLGAGPDDVRPALVAASMTAAFATVRDRLEATRSMPDHQEVMQILDQVLEFLRGGLEAMRGQ